MLPNPLILLLDDNVFEIADGSHRLTVFFKLLGDPKTQNLLENHQLAWVGVPCVGVPFLTRLRT